MDLYYELTLSSGRSYSEGFVYMTDEWDNLAYSTPITGLSGTIEWDGMRNQGYYDECYLPPGQFDLGIHVDLPGEDIHQNTDTVSLTPHPGKKYASAKRQNYFLNDWHGAKAKFFIIVV